MKNLINKNGSYNRYVQILVDGLQGPNYEEYVELLSSALNNYLDDWDDLCWHPNNDDTLWMMLESGNSSITDFLHYASMRNYDRNKDYIKLSSLETKYSDEVRDFYLLEIADPQHHKIICDAITEIQCELLELSGSQN